MLPFSVNIADGRSSTRRINRGFAEGARLARDLLNPSSGTQALKLYSIIATSKLGRRVQSGPWSARWIRRKALTYESGGFSDVAIVDLGDKQEFALAEFLAHHPLGDEQGRDWQLDA